MLVKELELAFISVVQNGFYCKNVIKFVSAEINIMSLRWIFF